MAREIGRSRRARVTSELITAPSAAVNTDAVVFGRCHFPKTWRRLTEHLLTFPNVLVAGSSGQVALALKRVAAWRGLPVRAYGRPELDIARPDRIEWLLDGASPHVVINAAAYTAVDKAESEPELAAAVNRDGAAALARACAKRNIPLIHISTDYVFDGAKSSPYVEDDNIAPLGVYGVTKAAGEAAVRAHTPRHVIVRTSWVYGPDGANFLKTMLRLGAVRDELGVVGDQHGAPTRADDLASALIEIAQAVHAGPHKNLWGTYHLAGGGDTTWHGFASAIFEHAAATGLSTPRLKCIATSDYPTPAKRPANSRLDQSKILAAFGIELPGWRDSLAAHFAGTELHNPIPALKRA